MSDIVRIREIPEPIVIKGGQERLVSGWNTAAVAKWLVNKKIEIVGFIGLSEVAVFAYGRDSAANRQSVKRNISNLRRHMATTNEFLIVSYGFQRRVEAIKSCNFANENDRLIAGEQLTMLEAKGEVTLFEAERWRKMLFLPT